ncbi:MAG: HD domain-containing protein [Candidatus Omnitrophica bacterium]|nr:HD domain-containing protein [Candidatus Omnitrophota bacterium]
MRPSRTFKNIPLPCAIPQDDSVILDTVRRFSAAHKAKVYMVGGYLRDILLKRQKINPDMDFALQKGSIHFARALCRRMKCGFVLLDKERGIVRLVKKFKGKIYTLDFADFRGRTLEEDLRLRDFTVNALALELGGLKRARAPESGIIDPHGGLDDLRRGVLKIADKTVFDDDPLRILRGFSLSAIFGFVIDKDALKYLKLARDKLGAVSPERVRDELFKILDTPHSASYLEEMDKLRVLSAALPEIEVMRGVKQGPYHHLDVWRHSLETVRQLEEALKKFSGNSVVQAYLNEEICAGRKRRALLKLGALLHDIGKPASKRREKGRTKFHGHERVGMLITRAISGRLKLSNEEINSLRKMVFWHLRPGYLADNEEITPRAKFRYFRDTGREGVSVLLLSIGDQRATRGPLTSESERRHHEKVVFGLISEYLRRKKEKPLRRLINGDDLIKKFHLASSPFIGEILKDIEELQAIGKVRTKKQALAAARDIVLKASNRT